VQVKEYCEPNVLTEDKTVGIGQRDQRHSFAAQFCLFVNLHLSY
jgi:hypothetical protein